MVVNCSNPAVMGMHLYPCGQCIPCRLNKQRLWMHRILLESKLHGDNNFVTLTYEDKNLPFGGNLVPEHGQLWLKKLRKRYEAKLRYYFVGEYGDQSFRPHYHVALFGYVRCFRGRTKRDIKGRVDWKGCCPACRLIGDTWEYGDIECGVLEDGSARYLAGYVTKKMTHRNDPRLEGRYPEFARMSLKPGIGLGMIDELASTCLQYNLVKLDVPYAMRHGDKEMPLGRYLRRNLRLRVGRVAEAPQAAHDEYQQKMYELQAPYGEDASLVSQKQKVLAATKGIRAGIVARSKIRKQGRTL